MLSRLLAAVQPFLKRAEAAAFLSSSSAPPASRTVRVHLHPFMRVVVVEHDQDGTPRTAFCASDWKLAPPGSLTRADDLRQKMDLRSVVDGIVQRIPGRDFENRPERLLIVVDPGLSQAEVVLTLRPLSALEKVQGNVLLELRASGTR